MNILIVSHFFPPHKGGVETAALNTARKFSEFGNKVVVVTSKCEDEKRDFYKLDDILVYRFKSYNLPELKFLPQSSNLGYMFRPILALPKIIQKHKIQVILIESHLFPIALISYLINRLFFKKPTFVFIQGRLNEGLWRLIETVYDRIATKWFLKKVNKFICVSKSLKRRLIKMGLNPSRLCVIPNGVNVSKFKKTVGENYLDRYLNNKKKKKVLFVGRLDKQKGVEYLIKAIPLILKENKNIHFFILGNGKMEKEIKMLAKNLDIKSNITFLDMVPLKLMPKFYNSADIFCLPSIHEGFPLSIAEALSSGMVIVASSTEGIPEAIEEGKNGFLVEPKNVQQLKEKILKAIELPSNRIKRIQENNIKLAKKRYSWDIIVKKINKLIKNSLRD